MSIEQKTSAHWKRCGVCKRDLGFDKAYYECSVSTCTSGRNHVVFCSVDCWNEHVPSMRHRDAWAIQKRSPTRGQWEHEQSELARAAAAEKKPEGETKPTRRIVAPPRSEPAPSAEPHKDVSSEILVVASKVKAYVRARSGMNTSDAVMEKLSDTLREVLDRAIDHARFAGRKTVMDRDFTGKG